MAERDIKPAKGTVIKIWSPKVAHTQSKPASGETKERGDNIVSGGGIDNELALITAGFTLYLWIFTDANGWIVLGIFIVGWIIAVVVGTATDNRRKKEIKIREDRITKMKKRREEERLIDVEIEKEYQESLQRDKDRLKDEPFDLH